MTLKLIEQLAMDKQCINLVRGSELNKSNWGMDIQAFGIISLLVRCGEADRIPYHFGFRENSPAALQDGSGKGGFIGIIALYSMEPHF